MYKNYIKRVLDIIISFIILITLLPLYLIIAIIIKIFDRGPVLYKQDRTGKDGSIFKIYKFKTMKNDKCTRLR